MNTSCGVLILDRQDRLLVAHATGRRYWDIPKGGAEPGETALQAALREAMEETGIALDAAGMEDLGTHDYLPAKRLHLFRIRVDESTFDLAACRCSSLFTDQRGRFLPEVDRYAWAGRPEIAKLCTARMAALLQRLLG